MLKRDFEEKLLAWKIIRIRKHFVFLEHGKSANRQNDDCKRVCEKAL